MSGFFCDKKVQYIVALFCYATIFWAVTYGLGIWAINQLLMASESMSFESNLWPMEQDWGTLPYVDMVVVEADACPIEYPDAVFKREFLGVEMGCDCLGIY
jgi:hypothetical protein